MRKIQNLAVAAIAFAATVASSNALADTIIDTVEVTGSGMPVLCYGADCAWYLDNWNTYALELNFDESAGGSGGPAMSDESTTSDAVKVEAKCHGDAEMRQASATLAYKAHFGISVLRQARSDIGRNYTITFENGSQGVYQRDINPDGRASNLFIEREAPSCN